MFGGAFSSKLIQLRLNTIYNSEFRFSWGGGEGVPKISGGLRTPRKSVPDQRLTSKIVWY